MPEQRRRRKRKSSVAYSGALRYKTKFSPLRLITLSLSARWVPPAYVSSVIVMIYVFFYSSSFTLLIYPLDSLQSLTFSETGGGFTDDREAAVELIKADIGIGLYVIVLLYSLFFFRAILRAIFANPHILLIFGLLLFGMTYSVNPQEVFNSVVQIGIGLLIAVVFAIQNSGKDRWDRRFCAVFLLPLFLVHSISVVLFFSNGLVFADFAFGAARYGGLPGHPNVAGASAVIGVWASLHLLLSGVKGRQNTFFCVLAILPFAFSISVAGSATALGVSASIAALLVWLKFLSVFDSPVKRVIYVFFGLFITILLIGSTFLANSTQEIAERLTSSMGKETNLTGRTELWDMAFAAIKEKPILGWSYDQHESVQTNRLFVLPNNLTHFHNGFLDTAVAGGLLLLSVVLWNMFQYVRYWFSACSHKIYLLGFLGPFALLVMMNFSEYSLLRPLNVIYEFYLCAYFMLYFASISERDAPTNDGKLAVSVVGQRPKSKRKRGSTSGKQYRF